MQKRLLHWELIGFAFTGAVGTLLHFVYEWTGGSSRRSAPSMSPPGST